MRLPEYKSKAIFKKYGIRVPEGSVVKREEYEDKKTAYEELPSPCVAKAQNMIGGRGKAGGIKLSSDRESLKKHVKELFEEGFSGNIVEEILVEEKISIEKETYLSISIDRAAGNFSLIASGKGGIDIESNDASEMRKVEISNLIGLQKYQAAYAAKPIIEAGASREEALDIAAKLYRILKEENALLVEINPLAILTDGSLIAADAKIILDDNARRFAKKDDEIKEKKALSPLEEAAKALGVNMVEIGGDIAVISNGAGEGMATIDQIIQPGGSISLWIDLGGGALSAKPEILDDFIESVMDTKPKVLLFTAFFQIGKCDLFAESFRKIYEKRKTAGKYIPQIILRLDGRNAEEAKKFAADTDMLILDSSQEACEAAVGFSAASRTTSGGK